MIEKSYNLHIEILGFVLAFYFLDKLSALAVNNDFKINRKRNTSFSYLKNPNRLWQIGVYNE